MPSDIQSVLGEPLAPETHQAISGDPGDYQAFLNADARGGALSGKESLTIDEAAYTLVRGDPGWSAALGVGYTVTYAFRANAPGRMPEDVTGFQRFNDVQIAQTELALQAWSDVANIRFTRVGTGPGELAYGDNASILFANYTNGGDGAAGFAMYPGNPSISSSSGDVWIRIGVSSNSAPASGNYGGQVLVHEIGHAIGLAHPGDYDATEDEVFTYAADGAYYEDSRQYTVMSYFGESNTGANFQGRYSAVPLLDDIAAIQLEYGVNAATRTADTVYGFNSTAGREWFPATSSSSRLVFAVWDAGGRDTLDFSGYANSQIIDLRAGFFSNVGGLVGNVAIAQGATIEDARGGSGADLMTGNGAANSMSAGAGADTLSGGDGQDILRGDDGADSLSGGAAFDDVNGNMGNDTASGGEGDDWVVGGKDQDRLSGDNGHDVVFGNLGEDTLDGGAGNDIVRGGQGNDLMAGGEGDDFMSGDLGFDTMTGGAGADVFHMVAGASVDRVTDYSIGQGDRVQLLPGQAFSVRQSGVDTIVDLGDNSILVLSNVDSGSLQPGWIFGF